jgi:hypothetical protein
VRTGNLSAYLLVAVEQAYQEAVQSVSIQRIPNNARNHNPMRVLVPLLEFNHLDVTAYSRFRFEQVLTYWDAYFILRVGITIEY